MVHSVRMNLVLEVTPRHVRQNEVHELARAQTLLIVRRHLVHEQRCTATVILDHRRIHERQRVGPTEAAHGLDLCERLAHGLGAMLTLDLHEFHKTYFFQCIQFVRACIAHEVHPTEPALAKQADDLVGRSMHHDRGAGRKR